MKEHINDSKYSLCEDGGCQRVAVVQFRRDRFDPDGNLRRITEIIRGISGVDFVLLPEAWRGPKLIDMPELDALLAEWGEIAAAQQYTLLTGGLFVDTGEGVYDMCHVIGPDGKVAGVTEKIFPSLPVGEREFCKPGTRLPIYEVGGVRFGVLICVDMMYPELARSLVDRGADIIFNPANIPAKRLPLWHSLITIRAAENTVFTVFACNTGTTYPDNRDVLGGSSAVHPFGALLFEADGEECVHVVELELGALPRIRERWAYLDDIREIESIDSGLVVKKINI